MKGVVFTVDAILALAVASTLMFMTFTVLAKAGAEAGKALQEMQLDRITSDTLSSMEKKGVFKEAVLADSAAPLDSFLAILPESLCTSVLVKNSDGKVALASVPNCTCETRAVVKKRGFTVIRGGTLEIYLSEAKTCPA